MLVEVVEEEEAEAEAAGDAVMPWEWVTESFRALQLVSFLSWQAVVVSLSLSSLSIHYI